MRSVKESSLKYISGALLLMLLTAVLAFAQTTGSLQGIVRDPNGAVVSGATVRVTNTATGQVRDTTTNENGFYRITNLIPVMPTKLRSVLPDLPIE